MRDVEVLGIGQLGPNALGDAGADRVLFLLPRAAGGLECGGELIEVAHVVEVLLGCEMRQAPARPVALVADELVIQDDRGE